MIEIQNIVKRFKSKKQDITAVDHVSLSIKKGEIFGVIGYSGAGKSTLIRMINLLEAPTEGKVILDGTDLSTLSTRQLRQKRQKIGMIFQHFNLLWSRTVKENIMFPLEIAGVPKAQREQRAKELINLVGLDGKEDQYPSQLSGGQKQRVGIARALANEPHVLLCDEATSALDPKTTDSILDLLKEINRRLGLTIVLITHEMHVIRKICDRVAVMEAGRVVELGDVTDIFHHPQQEITKQFVKQVTESDEALSASAERHVHNGWVLECRFMGEAAGKPVISQLIRQFEIEVNILQGKISRLKDASYGTLYIQVTGDEAEVNRAIDHLKVQGVEVEVLLS
ncbi:D-methionine transport system ATP-binding protein [Caldalkalibacillus uzonensis]|uniref:D-methionine transport system ATP-binding protein n=1 Tax=Caldalkalibacillus uzonensis TaxID=353224 RepID=A0ABU0CPA5_9BACI|nr:methionine ABC transporter ATP-binding protein [Caldalkalibacillus uzonensis]MDQ0338243.1 D-methionine transport system ATP-binding protein [Caldalkalibacillus uzonensis]